MGKEEENALVVGRRGKDERGEEEELALELGMVKRMKMGRRRNLHFYWDGERE